MVRVQQLHRVLVGAGTHLPKRSETPRRGLRTRGEALRAEDLEGPGGAGDPPVELV